MKSAKQPKSGEDIKIQLLRSKHSVAWLARRIGRPRSSVSRAIHQGCFPRIRQQIEEVLSA